MAVPLTKVELGINLVELDDQPFRLDSLSYGILGQDKIAGITFFDVSEFVQSVTVSRGRSTQLDYFQAGSATVNFDNRGRQFDPLNQDSPYYPEVKPRRLVRITTNDVPVFYGIITDWDIDYDIVENDTAKIYCADIFSVLANMQLAAVTPSAQLTGARINYALERPEIDFVGGREIDAGLSTVGAYQISAQTGLLNYLRQVERSEQGSLFVSAAGNLIFRERNSVDGGVVFFADDGSGIPYSSLSNQFGDELLYNRVVLKSPAGSAVVNSDNDSILKYQTSELEWDDLLNSSTTEITNMAKFLLTKFSEPRLRFTGISLELSGQSEENVASVLSVELADYVNLVKSFGVGSPSSVEQFSLVSGISHQITPGSHKISFNLESVGERAFLILGNDPFGKLDEYVLSF